MQPKKFMFFLSFCHAYTLLSHIFSGSVHTLFTESSKQTSFKGKKRQKLVILFVSFSDLF